jgi:DNA-binding MurR/RpiR family transcriptional regulator
MKLHTSRAWLHKRFLLEKMSIEDMAKEAKVTEMTIRRALEKEGFK